MAQIFVEIFGRVLVEGIGLLIGAAARSALSDRNTRPKQSPRRINLSAAPPVIHHPRAVLIASSVITFGNECERLVNIAFQTSQSFPNMMATCGDVILYLRKELLKRYPDEYFHIVIAQNCGFGFSIEDGQHFAEIEQERYRVLIFSSKQNDAIKCDSHDANSQLRLCWT